MTSLPERMRIGTRGSAIRYELAQALSIDPPDCDRMALCLGLALPDSSRNGDSHLLKQLVDVYAIRTKSDPTDDDSRGEEIELNGLIPPSMHGLFHPFLKVQSLLAEADMRRLINSGYRFLETLYDRMDRDAERVMRTLADHASIDSPANLPCDTALPQSGPITISLGREVSSGRDIRWTVNREEGLDTSASLRIAGSQGKGKSQALLGLLHSIIEEAPDTGFILLDYKGDLSDGDTGTQFRDAIERARLIRPPETPIPMNPFDLPRDANLELAAEMFSGTLAAIIPHMGPVQQGNVDKALTSAYRNARLIGQNGPSLVEARDAVRAYYEETGSKSDSVIHTLDRLADKPIFSARSETEVGEVFRQRWIVDLSKLGDLRDYVAFILIHFLRQTAESLPDAPFDRTAHVRTLRGVIAIDEAHHYLPKGRKSQPLAQLVRIGRSKGIPVFLSSQSLDDFKGDTAWRELVPNNLVFGHGAPPDVETLQGALKVDPRTAKIASNECVSLEQFIAFSHHSKDGKGSLSKLRVTPFFERITKNG